MPPDDPDNKILAAIGALDEKVDKQFADLRKADGHIVDEIQLIKRDVEGVKAEVRDLRAETLRTFETERHNSAQTTQAITRHVDESARAFREKAADIDALKEETKQQSAELAKQTAILTRLDAVAANPMVRRVAYLIGLAIAGWLASKGIK